MKRFELYIQEAIGYKNTARVIKVMGGRKRQSDKLRKAYEITHKNLLDTIRKGNGGNFGRLGDRLSRQNDALNASYGKARRFMDRTLNPAAKASKNAKIAISDNAATRRRLLSRRARKSRLRQRNKVGK